MVTAIMRNPTSEVSPRMQARIAGFLYLLIMIGAVFAPFAFAPSAMMHDDAGLPFLAKILAAKPSYVFGGFIQLLVYACDVGVAVIFYELLKPVGRSVALLATFLRLVFVAIASANMFNHFAVLAVLSGSDYLGVFLPSQLRALALTFIKLRTFGFDIALVFFGLHCLVLEYLLYRSTFLPRILGIGLAIAGTGYLVNMFVTPIPPEIGAYLFPWVLLPAGIADFSLAMWLIFVGVNVARWNEVAGAKGDARR